MDKQPVRKHHRLGFCMQCKNEKIKTVLPVKQSKADVEALKAIDAQDNGVYLPLMWRDFS